VSSPSKPEDSSVDKSSFGVVIQQSWDQYHPKEVKQEDESVRTTTTEQSTQQSTPCPPLPRQEVTPAPTATRAISPLADSPQALKDDRDLQEFFSSILSTECCRQKDLFLPNVTNVGLRKKLKAFGMQLAANNHMKTYAAFHETPNAYLKKDITKMDPDPCLTKRFGIPMTVPAMAEVAQAIVNLAEDIPEALQLSKHSGSKGSGKRIIAITPSVDKR